MNTADSRRWVDESRLAIAAELERLRAPIDAIAAGETPVLPMPAEDRDTSSLDSLARLFGLEPVERMILLLAAGAELDPSFAHSIVGARAQSGGRMDVSLALALAPDGGWEALCPEAPLRRWRMLDLPGSLPLFRCPLVVDERILHFITGINYLDARLEGLVAPVTASADADLSKGQRNLVDRLIGAWRVPTKPDWPVLLLAGKDAQAKRAVLFEVCAANGLRLFHIDAMDIPKSWSERHGLSVYCERELILSHAALLIECPQHSDAEASHAAARLADDLQGPVAIAATDPEAPRRAPRLRVELPVPGQDERRAIWYTAIGPNAEALGSGLDLLSEQFALDPASIGMAVDTALNGTPVAPELLLRKLWDAAREQGRRRIDGLAQRIDCKVSWGDLVLPDEQLSQLQDLAVHVRQSWRVNQHWGWADKSTRGLGAAALFAGASGTGKTLAAEVLANELRLDLYRIDLSQIVSKYIGETEKNLARIFEAAEDGGAILLFDEADALFGKRSEVKDSHDRYANVEVSYLLQCMEAYRGLAILTSNLKSAIDQAFLRRLRFVITFPFPDAASRAAIWARIFPKATPREGVNPARLARMSISGGSIRSIALNASFLAAEAGVPVRPEHLLNAARREYAKLEKPFTSAEAGGLR